MIFMKDLRRGYSIRYLHDARGTIKTFYPRERGNVNITSGWLLKAYQLFSVELNDLPVL